MNPVFLEWDQSVERPQYLKSDEQQRPDNAPPAVQPTRRGSWVSVSSTGPNFNSSLLDSELFDAFPSVPKNHPLVLPNNNSSYSPTSSTSLSSSTTPNSAPFLPSPVRDRGQGMVQSFDAALLSSTAQPNDNGSVSAGFLAPNSAASVRIVPPESVGTVGGGAYANGMNARDEDEETA
ncbi:hypothetical protein P691DRAFT_789888 [Macrolepiota fuliginosa MF-IS2]|uniref:Uncharacterized protein n=1 Tax=Macrolepiota fuliginosa MF-IS2 TaxID=1400762 RepID=A0A9P5X2H0_9AGAR|nr:hypothetical protein P691DRAFT_789888 [Macrolepiota fuliginosa MF-IS2]